jgi:hypothetical protein
LKAVASFLEKACQLSGHGRIILSVPPFDRSSESQPERGSARRQKVMVHRLLMQDVDERVSDRKRAVRQFMCANHPQKPVDAIELLEPTVCFGRIVVTRIGHD